MTKKKTQEKTAPKNLSVKECPTNQQAKAAFLKEVEEGGHRDTVSKVTYCLDFLLSSGRPFTEGDLWIALRQFEIENVSEVQRLFLKWRELLEGMNKITVLRNGAYDTELIVPIG
jgi:hypothetical protein